MQRNNGISSSEWRWVITFSFVLIAITVVPYAWAFASNPNANNWQFMGILTNPFDGASYLSKIGEGLRGNWLYTMQYTPEATSGAAIHEFYLLLGHLAGITGLSPLLMFHIARLVTSFIMYLSIYHLGSVIWPRLRPRRLFFSLLAVGSGLGWLFLIFAGRPSVTPDFNWLPTDFSIPESIPFFATYANPHFPFAIALIALIAATFITVFRPGFDQQPTFSNGGIGLILLSVGLAITQPQGIVGITAALIIYVAILTWRTRQLPMMELNWVVLVVLPALPFLIYYLAVVRDIPAMRIWNEQNQTPSPPLLNYIAGFGLLLVIAVPGMWRAIRHFERDGDRFMVVWFVINAVLLYAPFNLQRRLAIGLIIPIGYFAVRALEDYWFHRIHPPWRDAALVAVFVFIIPSNVLSLGIPIFGIVNPIEGIKGQQLLYAGHSDAIRWLSEHAGLDDIVLAPPSVSLWIPAYTPLRVVYGHPYETLDAQTKLNEVRNWYNGQDCQSIFEKYGVRYVVSDYIQPSESQPPTEGCYKTLGEPLASFKNVYVYAAP